jgi:hypothetical protein
MQQRPLPAVCQLRACRMTGPRMLARRACFLAMPASIGIEAVQCETRWRKCLRFPLSDPPLL